MFSRTALPATVLGVVSKPLNIVPLTSATLQCPKSRISSATVNRNIYWDLRKWVTRDRNADKVGGGVGIGIGVDNRCGFDTDSDPDARKPPLSLTSAKLCNVRKHGTFLTSIDNTLCRACSSAAALAPSSHGRPYRTHP